MGITNAKMGSTMYNDVIAAPRGRRHMASVEEADEEGAKRTRRGRDEDGGEVESIGRPVDAGDTAERSDEHSGRTHQVTT